MQEHSTKGASRPSLTAPRVAGAAAPLLMAALLGLCASSALAAAAYKAAGAVPLGDPAFWDYALSDPITGRVYVAHADKVAVIDGRAGKLIGNVEGIPGGTHGIAISAATGQGFSDDGRNGQAIAFDLKTLKIRDRIPAAQDADGIAFDRGTGHVFVVEGDSKTITVVDPRSDKAVATIDVGEGMEFPVGSDDKVFIAGVEKRDLIEVDPRTNGVIARWPIADCERPHGLAVDGRNHRAFVGCVNAKMMVVDTRNGKLVTELTIGRGNDAVAFDSNRKRVFSSNGRDGTISVYEETSPDKYTQLEDIKTVVSGRTMTVDTVTGRLFVPVADQDPNSPAGQRPRMIAGSARVLMFDPVR
ncbi:MAG TPA: YncE family protein [Caulobacteraceae bacterium]